MEYRARHNQNHIWNVKEAIIEKNARYGIVQLVHSLFGNEKMRCEAWRRKSW